jgi:hypothetical protein
MGCDLHHGVSQMRRVASGEGRGPIRHIKENDYVDLTYSEA